MLASFRESCAECSGEVVDMGDELVCRSCGVVTCKEVVEVKAGGTPQAIDYTGQALGGYLGPLEYGPREKFCRGLVGSPSSFRYLKLVSDYGGREDSTVYSCVKMIERVCEKLSLPKIVMGQAIVIAKKLFEVKNSGVRIIHRVAWPEDLALVGDSLSLTPEQKEHIANLQVGEAVVSLSRIQKPMLVQVRADSVLSVENKDLNFTAEP